MPYNGSPANAGVIIMDPRIDHEYSGKILYPLLLRFCSVPIRTTLLIRNVQYHFTKFELCELTKMRGMFINETEDVCSKTLCCYVCTGTS